MKNKNLIFSLLALVITFVFSSCSNDGPGIITPVQTVSDVPDVSEKGENPDDAELSLQTDNRGAGYLYVQSNDAVLNTVLVYKQNNNGTLTLQTTVNSGGAGSGGSLGNQGALEIQNSEWLYAVNAGSNSVSSFKISHEGNLILKNTIATGGVRPVSVTVHEHTLYVVNAGSDNISGFRVGPDGTFTAIPLSVKPLSAAGTGPAQISFSPNGRYLYVTEKATNKITTFHVENNGVPGNGTSITSTGQTPFGVDFARSSFMIVSNAAGGAPNQSSATSYSGVNSGSLSPVNGSVGNNQAAACWVATTKFGRFAFVTNTASDNISSYYIGLHGGLYLLHAAIPTEDAPTEIMVANNNIYVYALNSASHTISAYKRTLLGSLNLIGTTSGVPNAATGFAVK